MGDWMISKRRFWGLALPIWVCEQCGAFEVIGGRAELKQRAVAGWEKFEGHTPHRPWIDLVKVRCAKCGGEANRIPDVGNPWLDAGIVPYSTMGYNRDRACWEKWFPADFITESFPGQFRNWFYAILAMSTMMERRPPMKVLLGHAQVRDEHGEEMHKSKGNAIPFEAAADEGWVVTFKDGKQEKRPPMGADLMRWLFCRQNPANNLNFGSGPAEELRSKFTLKLWNTYAFFCNNARQERGGFDWQAPPVPVRERHDLDRWILSDLQLLIRKAREEFSRYNVQAMCLEAETFVDERLSNWYVRRNRRRFWKSEEGRDKLAAFQTLHTVLLTLAKLFAPVMPFLSEALYHNLVVQGTGTGDSVHLCDFPEVDEPLIDGDLSADMDALLRIVSLGSAARNSVKVKRRQPVAEMKVQPGNERERRAVERFADQICDELNVKRLTLHDSAGPPLLRLRVKVNPKTLGPKLGPRLEEARRALAAADQALVAERFQAGEPFALTMAAGVFLLEADDLIVEAEPPENWAGASDRGTQVVIDTRITPALAGEGRAREVVRQVQELRKKSGLEMEDRIALHLQTEAPALQQAIAAHRDYICAETLAIEWATQSLDGQAHRTSVKVDGQPLVIELRKVAS
jgi:isoleucyl-tRNA synthetase